MPGADEQVLLALEQEDEREGAATLRDILQLHDGHAARTVQGQPVVLAFDLQEFFASVRASRVHALFETLGVLAPEHLAQEVLIRREPHTVFEALERRQIAARCEKVRSKMPSAIRFFSISMEPPAIIQPRVLRTQYSTSRSWL